jgi:TonB-linked SusC/RagA family outer membrane protein
MSRTKNFYHFIIGLMVIVMIALAWKQPVYAQDTGTVTGVLIDEETGDPLTGANIILQGTNLGAATDINGVYKIENVPAGNYTLSASYIGYEGKSQSITVVAGEVLKISFSMQPGVLEAEQIVVIGYGTSEKRDLLGAVSSVDVEELKKVSSSNTLSALEGRVPGLTIEPMSGQPDSDPNIKLRGTGTMNDNRPLYIIDGVPGDISFVAPEEIASMTVLKDASAAAIYGSRAGNGVIIVETKRGYKGQPMDIQFSASYSIQNLTKKWEVLNAKEFMETVGGAAQRAHDADPNYLIPEPFVQYFANPDSFLAANPDVDWQDEYYGSSVPIKRYNLTVSGGGENTNYSVSGTYFDQEGIASDTWADRFSIRVNSDFTKGKMKIGESMSVGRSRAEFVNGDAGGRYPHFQVLGMAPTVSPYADDEDGYGGPTIGYSDAAINIIGNNNLRDNITTTENLKATGYLEYEILKGLKYELRGNYSINNLTNFYYAPTYKMGYRSENVTADLNEDRQRTYYTVLENFLSYETQIEKHKINALLGFSREKAEYRNEYASIENFPANDLPVFDAGTENPGVAGEERVSKLQSMFTRAFYSYNDKYLANFTIRRDGSSRFSKDNRYGNFPSISLGWRVSSEPLFKNVPLSDKVDDLKIRFDWGKLGNQEIGDYTYIPGLTIGVPFGEWDIYNINYPFGDNVYTGGAITSFPAYDLKWEETTTTDIGFDLTLLKNRITFSTDFYYKMTDGILYATPIPWSTGVATGPLTNIAKMENWGYEFSASYREIGGDFNYIVNANLTTINNKVKQLGTEKEVYWAGAMEWGQYLCTKTVVGGEIGAFYLYETDGIFQSQAEINSYVGSDGQLIQPDAAPGDIKFIDQNGDGLLDEKDKIYMGSGIPDFEYGLSFTGSYKNFDLSLNFHGAYGKKMFNGTKWYMERMVGTYNWDKETLNAWTPTNTNTDVPRAVLDDPNWNERESDRWLESASYLRLRNIQLGYTIPKTVSFGFGTGTIRIYISADNLFTITPYTGYDPAVTGGNPALPGSELFVRGVDTGIYPTARTISSGIEINFK